MLRRASADPLRRRSQSSLHAPPIPQALVQKVLSSPGRPLEPSTRAPFERSFAHDFSRVRVHTDSRAATSARTLNAHAYTHGQHIVFEHGKFAPQAASGQQLLGHELAHVVQQSGETTSHSKPVLGLSAVGTAHERAADAAAHAAISGRPASDLSAVSGSPGIQRAPAGTDALHSSLIEDWRRAHCLPPGGLDENGQPMGPTDSQIRFGGLLEAWLTLLNSGPRVAEPTTAASVAANGLQTNGGTWQTTRYATVSLGAPGTLGQRFGCDIALSFTPNNLVEAANIGLTQTTRALSQSTAAGDMDTPIPSSPRNTALSLPAGSVDRGRAIDQGDTGDADTIPNTSPLYAVENTPGNVATSLTNVLPVAGAGLGDHGRRVRRPNGTFDVHAATLNDAPVGTIRFAGQRRELSFETTALVLDGPMASTYLGSVAWGCAIDATGAVTLDPNPIRVVRAGAPSSAFMAAARVWNDATFTDPTSGAVHDTVDLPLTSGDSGSRAAPYMATSALRSRLTLVEAELARLPPGVDRTNKEFERQALRTELSVRGAGPGCG